MSKGTHNVSVVVINIISNNWELKDVTVDLFEAFDIIEAIMAFQL
jgi:hypothetical protein